MSRTWNEAAIQRYIDESIEESLTLDYKGAGALEKNPEKKLEVTKAISAMANSAGGIVIYGVDEYKSKDKKHLPEKIDPVDRAICSREWLEQVILTIRPKIEGIIIHPVPLSSGPNHVAYVIEIPQSNTAHQALDWRYYKRFNFESVPMEDYEIRDIMNRTQHPKIELGFKIEITQISGNRMFLPHDPPKTECTLLVLAKNIGKIYAQYVNAIIEIPTELAYIPEEIEGPTKEKFMKKLRTRFRQENTIRDIMEHGIGGITDKYGPSRFNPILPGLSQTWKIRITSKFEGIEKDGLKIEWSVYADNAPESKGKVPIKAIKVVDER